MLQVPGKGQTGRTRRHQHMPEPGAENAEDQHPGDHIPVIIRGIAALFPHLNGQTDACQYAEHYDQPVVMQEKRADYDSFTDKLHAYCPDVNPDFSSYAAAAEQR